MFNWIPLFVALGAASGPAEAQGDAWLDSTFNTFESRHPALSPIQSYRVDLAEGGRSRFTFNAQAGTIYVVVGLCAENCSDVNVEVFSGSTSIGSDTLPDQVPAVTFRATRSGAHTVEVAMANCEASTCRAGAKAYVG